MLHRLNPTPNSLQAVIAPAEPTIYDEIHGRPRL